MRLTVAICTWNRAALLDRTLSELRRLRIPEGVEWELLVVNNNCTDDTDAVLARHQGRLPLRRLFELKQGHSNARNCAVDAAQGDLILWTDDDVLVDPEWLAAYVVASRRWPDACFFGGAIEPWFERQPPLWVLPCLARERGDTARDGIEGMFVIRDFGPAERLFADSEQPWGANMAFRLISLRHHRFDPNLGLNGPDNVRGDERTVLVPLRTNGANGVWVPAARVRHFVPAHRMTRKYLWDYFHGSGRSEVRARAFSNEGRTWGGAPRWLYRQVFQLWMLAHWQRLWTRTAWVPTYIRAALYSGVITEFRCQARSGRAGSSLSPQQVECGS